MLLIFELNGTLGYINEKFATQKSMGIYTGKIIPDTILNEYEIYNRPSIKLFT